MDFELPEDREFARVRVWREACLAHSAAQQVSREEIVKLYFDYALGAGNGALPAGRSVSSFVFEPHWRTETVLALATGIEAERAFDRMPILADALLDADCDEEVVLRHCRESDLHARGCWVLDLILNREPAWFAAPPLEPRKRPRGRSRQMGPFSPPPENMM